MKIVNLNFEYIFFLFFFRPSMHNKRLISRKSVLIHVENPFLFFLSLLRQIVRKTRGTRCEIFSLLSENHCAKCDIRMSKQELSKPFGIIYGVLFFPSSFFFHPFPNRRSFKSWEESCANLESRNEKRNISSRLFPTLSTPSLPPHELSITGLGISSRYSLDDSCRRLSEKRSFFEKPWNLVFCLHLFNKLIFIPWNIVDTFDREKNVERVLYRACIAETNIYIYWCIDFYCILLLFVYVYYILLYMYIIICIVDNFITFFDYN